MTRTRTCSVTSRRTMTIRQSPSLTRKRRWAVCSFAPRGPTESRLPLSAAGGTATRCCRKRHQLIDAQPTDRRPATVTDRQWGLGWLGWRFKPMGGLAPAQRDESAIARPEAWKAAGGSARVHVRSADGLVHGQPWCLDPAAGSERGAIAAVRGPCAEHRVLVLGAEQEDTSWHLPVIPGVATHPDVARRARGTWDGWCESTASCTVCN